MHLLRAIWYLAESHNCDARLAGASTDGYRPTVLHDMLRFGESVELLQLYYAAAATAVSLPPTPGSVFLLELSLFSFRPSSGYELSTSQAQIDIPEPPRA